MATFINENCIIITFTDFRYLDIFNIFYAKFEKFKLNNLLVVSLDDKTYEILKNRNIKTIYEPYNIGDKNKFWNFRLSIINKLFKENKKNIIHTDSDCFWIKNILEEINKVSHKYDVIGSIGFGHPENIVKELGFSLCCGFYFIKYSNQTMNIFDNIVQTKPDFLDDQVLFNKYIYNNKKQVSENHKDYLICKDVILNDKTRIGIIKDMFISRNYKNNLFCYHPYLQETTVEGKILELVKRLMK
jgi:hypothetical protein